MSKKGSNPDTIYHHKKKTELLTMLLKRKLKCLTFLFYFISQSNIEDNNDVPDIPELTTSINQINLPIEEVNNTLKDLNISKATGPGW